MNMRSSFRIYNDFSLPITLYIEPEGAPFSLDPKQEVWVTDVFTKHPVTVKLWVCDDGNPVISIWPGDGEITVEKDGINVFELM
jgi:hypothetical protein